MNIKTKESTIGVFIILTLILVLGFLLVFAGRDTIAEKHTFTMLFQGNLKGLHPGTAVEYRGVKIGEIYKIDIKIDPKTTLMIMPILVHLRRGIVEYKKYHHRLRFLIKRGLRAQLKIGNFITGDQIITLVFKPKTKVVLHYPGKMEIPTLPSQTQEELIENTLNTAQETLKSITGFFKSQQLTSAVVASDKAFTQTAKTMRTANKTLTKTNRHINPVGMQLIEVLSTLQRAAYRLGTLSEYLARHPESIITGKRKPS